jgi:hypothetical protein
LAYALQTGLRDPAVSLKHRAHFVGADVGLHELAQECRALRLVDRAVFRCHQPREVRNAARVRTRLLSRRHGGHARLVRLASELRAIHIPNALARKHRPLHGAHVCGIQPEALGVAFQPCTVFRAALAPVGAAQGEHSTIAGLHHPIESDDRCAV